ncbi:unnamed protein product, partial [Mesorhabditis spiculigera]
MEQREQRVVVSWGKSTEGRYLTRQFTPSNVGAGFIEVPIKVYEEGRFSNIIAQWAVGDPVDWRGPYDTDHHFNFRELPSLLIVCSGTGIAPIPRILQKLFADDRAETRVRVVCCFSDPTSLIFGRELGFWASQWNCNISVYFSRPSNTNAALPYLVECHNHRLNETDFETEIAKLGTRSSMGDIQNLNRPRDVFEQLDVEDSGSKQAFCHIRLQQRTGRKTITTVQGISSEYELKKIVRYLKKEYNCNGTVVEHPEYGEVIQLSGDQRQHIKNFLTKVGIVKEENCKVHGF